MSKLKQLQLSGITYDLGAFTQDDLDAKQDVLVSGENIKTINGESVLGSGSLIIDATEYSAGTGIAISDHIISCTLDTSVFIVVDELPSVGTVGKIYLVPKEDEETGDVFDEYTYLEDTGWEKLGTAKMDLSNYYTKTETDGLLAAKAALSAFTAHTADTTVHITSSERSTWNAKTDESDVKEIINDTFSVSGEMLIINQWTN